ncbi:hypothetical protein FHR84_001008 [Actinopolyspora biskrensis]|uniref:Uncharacterized protein n=1 Tax=Actinopolyspora biskrensis TaxID=1470178 RepID=A0A852YR29_9ACTN|nr:hypothetical protein [Actinopolyspora biskrensis]NYH77694.1 hypothetical protein [Actinopolyspora biskrensis]
MAGLGWKRFVVACAVVTTSASGCGVVGGAQAGTAEGALGDLSTYDPCGMTDPGALSESGEPTKSPENRSFFSFGQCAIELELDEGADLGVDIGLLERLEDRPETNSR